MWEDHRKEVLYLVMKVQKTVRLSINGITEADLPLDWVDGQAGCCLVFDNYADAEEFADGADVVPVWVPTATQRQAHQEPDRRMIRIGRR